MTHKIKDHNSLKINLNVVRKGKSQWVSLVFGEKFQEETEVELNVVRRERAKNKIINIEC